MKCKSARPRVGAYICKRMTSPNQLTCPGVVAAYLYVISSPQPGEGLFRACIMYGVFAATACFHNLYTLVKNVVPLDKVISGHNDDDDDDGGAGNRPPDEHGVSVRDAGVQPGQLGLAGGLPGHPDSAGRHINPDQ